MDELCGFSDHHMLRTATGIIKSHRDLGSFLKHYREHGKDKCYIYTGRGPSTVTMHLGHVLPFMISKILQSALGIRVVVLLTDDEKFLYRREHPLHTYTEFAQACKAQIMSMGFIPELTDIYIGTESIGRFYRSILRLQDKISFNHVSSVFGLCTDDSIGKIAFPAYEMAPCDPSTVYSDASDVRCMVVCAWDQDPYFRLLRDHAQTLGFHKPALLHLDYLPGLNGSLKMSSTAEADASSHKNNVIWLTDTKDVIREKIRKYAFSGGGATKALHAQLGADIQVDVPCRYLRMFMNDRERLAEMLDRYARGDVFSSAIKELCTDVIADLLAGGSP